MSCDIVQLLGKKHGCPLKHKNGWEGVNKRICISNTTFSLWRDVREELGLINGDALAIYLLGLHNKLNTEPIRSR